MDKEGLKKDSNNVGPGGWRSIDEIPYKDLYRVLLAMEEMRLEELEDVKEYIKGELQERIEDLRGNTILGRFYLKKKKGNKYNGSIQLYHVTNISGKIVIGDTITLDIMINSLHSPYGITIKDIQTDVQIFGWDGWVIKGTQITYDGGKDYDVVEISEATFLEVWTFAKQIIQIYEKL